MDKVCNSCLALRRVGVRVISNSIYGSLNTRPKSCQLPPVSSRNSVRHYAVKDRAEEKVYKHGKLITAHVEDPTEYPHFLMVFEGYDEAVLDTYYNFAKKAAKIVDVNMKKSFNMPAKHETFKAEEITEAGVKRQKEYNLKKYQRVIALQNLKGDKSDLYINYLQKAIPPGVNITMELKRWEMLVDPNHISLRNDDN